MQITPLAVALLGAAVVLSGCSAQQLSYRDTHVPVLLSRVERLGGGHANATQEVVEHERESSRFLSLQGAQSASYNLHGADPKETWLLSGVVNPLKQKDHHVRTERDVRLEGVRTHVREFVGVMGYIHDTKLRSEGAIVELTP